MHKLLICVSWLSLNTLHAMRTYALAEVSASEYCRVVAGAFNKQSSRTKKRVVKKVVEKDDRTCMQSFISLFTASNNK